MALTADGREAVLKRIADSNDDITQNNGQTDTRFVRILGYNSDSPGNVGEINWVATSPSISQAVTWESITDASSYSWLKSNQSNAITWDITPEEGESITVLSVVLQDENNDVIAETDVDETFERNGEFTIDQLQVAVE